MTAFAGPRSNAEVRPALHSGRADRQAEIVATKLSCRSALRSGVPNGGVTDREAIAALVSDLHWQIDQLPRRGIKDNAGNPYNPSYYKRGLQNAIDRGGPAVADYVRHYVYKAPSDGYKKLEEADSLDLACEALVADADRPYAPVYRNGPSGRIGAACPPQGGHRTSKGRDPKANQPSAAPSYPTTSRKSGRWPPEQPIRRMPSRSTRRSWSALPTTLWP